MSGQETQSPAAVAPGDVADAGEPVAAPQAGQDDLAAPGGSRTTQRAQRAAHRTSKLERAEANWRTCGGLGLASPAMPPSDTDGSQSPAGSSSSSGKLRPKAVGAAGAKRGSASSRGAQSPQSPPRVFPSPSAAMARAEGAESYPERARFDTLFTDLRRYRSDCILMWRAIRSGWLDGESPVVAEGLYGRFLASCEALGLTEHDERTPRKLLALLRWCETNLRIVKASYAAVTAELRYRPRPGRPQQTTGRPPTRRDRAELPPPVDVRELGFIYQPLHGSRRVQWPVRTPAGNRMVELVWPGNATRAFFRCPGCRTARTLLYAVRAGLRCRVCVGVR